MNPSLLFTAPHTTTVCSLFMMYSVSSNFLPGPWSSARLLKALRQSLMAEVQPVSTRHLPKRLQIIILLASIVMCSKINCTAKCNTGFLAAKQKILRLCFYYKQSRTAKFRKKAEKGQSVFGHRILTKYLPFKKIPAPLIIFYIFLYLLYLYLSMTSLLLLLIIPLARFLLVRALFTKYHPVKRPSQSNCNQRVRSPIKYSNRLFCVRLLLRSCLLSSITKTKAQIILFLNV